MKKSVLFLLLLSAATAMFPQSQLHVFEDWTGTAGTQNFFYKNVTKTDGSGNVYVAGATVNGSGTTDILVAKYNSGGTLQWTQQYNGLANYYDFATALMIDGSNNVFVTGAVSNDTLNPTTNTDVILIKYNSSGVQQWVSTYAGPAGYFDAGTDLYVTGAGVALSGSSMNSSFNMDYVTILYNSSGVQQWATVYDHSSHLNDVPVKISRKGNSLLVAGGVQTGAGSYDWAVIQYNASGVQTAFTSSTGGSPAIDSVFDMMEDPNGNIYIAGSTLTPTHGYDYDLVKLDSNLVIQWEKTYDGADHLDDVIRSVKADAAGNVYVTGFITTASQGLNYLTQKYNSAGTLIWSQPYNDSLNGDDEAHALVLDNAETSLYVTGFSYTDSLNGINYYTVKYDSAGTQQWAIPFDGDRHLRDKATNIAIDTTGNVIVTGESEVSAGMYEYATVRYVEKDIIVPTDFNSEPTPASFLYYANKGQLISTDSTLVPDVRFYTNSTYPAYYFKDDTLSMVFSSIDTIAATDDTLHRIDLSFPSCNEHLRIYPLDEQIGYLNYFLGHCPQGITEIHGQQRLVIHDLYDQIDLIYSSNQNGMKYYFIIKPGGDPDDIHLKYTGASSTGLSSNNLTINSLVGSITLDRPFTYQLNSSNDTIANSDVYADWHSNGSNDYDFDLHPFDSTKVLVIEVDEGNGVLTTSSTGNLEHSTYYGGANTDQFYDIQTDGAGNVYTTGYTYSSDFPVFFGVQTFFGGIEDATVVKFNNAMVLQWATYFGQAGQEEGLSVDIRGGNIYFAGTSTSSGIPHPLILPAGSLNDYTNGVGVDGFIAKINLAGTTLLWSTFLGGSGNEKLRELRFDGLGNFYCIGEGTSASPLKNKAGAYNNASGLGYIAKFNSLDTLVWACLIPGTQTLYSFAANGAGENCFSALCNANGFPIMTPAGAYVDNSFSGASDVGIMKLTPNDSIYWSTYFGGNSNESPGGIAYDAAFNIYVGGDTRSTEATFPYYYPNDTTVYCDSTLGSTGDAFFAKFDKNGKRKWVTFYGGATNYDGGTDVVCDAANNVYFTGQTSSTDFPLKALAAAYNQSPTSPTVYADAFIVSFNSNLKRLWSTCYSGVKQDIPFGIAAYQSSKLYLTGRTMSTNATFPLADLGGGAWYRDTLNNGGNSTSAWDGFIARFDLTPIVVSGIHEHTNENSEIVIYPNPGSGNAAIQIALDKPTDLKIFVYSGLGQMVYQKQLKNKNGVIQENIDISDMANGIYYISVITDKGKMSAKLIKQ